MNLARLATIGGPRVQLAVRKVGKYSPQILTTVGIVGGVAAAVLGARATLKLEPLLDNHRMGREIIGDRAEQNYYESERDYRKDVAYLHARTSLDLIKLYGPAVSLGAASIIAIVSAQHISYKRQVALVATVKSLESALSAYRTRVREAIGEEKEKDLWYGVKTETVTDADGKKTKVKAVDKNALSEYMAYFEPGNGNWHYESRELNFLYLKNMQNYANDRLETRGFVFLNEVYESLGIQPTQAGQIVGWLKRDHPEAGDGFIDFGIDNPVNDAARLLPDGLEEGILIDPNVDGEIISKF